MNQIFCKIQKLLQMMERAASHNIGQCNHLYMCRMMENCNLVVGVAEEMRFLKR